LFSHLLYCLATRRSLQEYLTVYQWIFNPDYSKLVPLESKNHIRKLKEAREILTKKNEDESKEQGFDFPEDNEQQDKTRGYLSQGNRKEEQLMALPWKKLRGMAESQGILKLKKSANTMKKSELIKCIMENTSTPTSSVTCSSTTDGITSSKDGSGGHQPRVSELRRTGQESTHESQEMVVTFLELTSFTTLK